METKTFTAKFPGTCCMCRETIEAGDTAAFDTGLFKGSKAIRHIDCKIDEYSAINRQIRDTKELLDDLYATKSRMEQSRG